MNHKDPLYGYILRTFYKIGDDLRHLLLHSLSVLIICFALSLTPLIARSQLLDLTPNSHQNICMNLINPSSVSKRKSPEEQIVSLVSQWLKTPRSQSEILFVKTNIKNKKNPFLGGHSSEEVRLFKAAELVFKTNGTAEQVNWSYIDQNVSSLLLTDAKEQERTREIDEATSRIIGFEDVNTNVIENSNFAIAPTIFKMPNGKYFALIFDILPKKEEAWIKVPTPGLYQYVPETGELSFLTRIHTLSHDPLQVDLLETATEFLNGNVSPIDDDKVLISFNDKKSVVYKVDISSGAILQELDLGGTESESYAINEIFIKSEEEIYISAKSEDKEEFINTNKLYRLNSMNGDVVNIRTLNHNTESSRDFLQMDENGIVRWFVFSKFHSTKLRVFTLESTEKKMIDQPTLEFEFPQNDYGLRNLSFHNLENGNWLIYIPGVDSADIFEYNSTENNVILLRQEASRQIHFSSIANIEANRQIIMKTYFLEGIYNIEFLVSSDNFNTFVEIEPYKIKNKMDIDQNSKPIIFSKEGRYFVLFQYWVNSIKIIEIDIENQTTLDLHSAEIRFNSFNGPFSTKPSLVKVDDNEIQILGVTPDRNIKALKVEM